MHNDRNVILCFQAWRINDNDVFNSVTGILGKKKFPEFSQQKSNLPTEVKPMYDLLGPVVQQPANANLGLKVTLVKSISTSSFKSQFESSQS